MVGTGEVATRRHFDVGAILLTALTIIAALVWFFPLYWAVATSLKPEEEVVGPLQLFPFHPTIAGYLYVIQHSNILTWYLNSTIVALATTFFVILIAVCCGYAISQLRFPGRMALWWVIIASFMIPVPALIVNHFIIMAGVKLLNTYPGIVLPQ
jgi:multiple sugar transport system permease protein